MSACAEIVAPRGSEGPSRGTVVVEAGLDERQVRAAMALHGQWAREEFGHALDEDAWLRTVWGLVNSGCWNVLVAWADGEPVGTVEMLVIYDPISRLRVGHGDHAFVAAEWRGRGVFSALVDAVYALGVAMGCEKTLLPVGVDARGQMLRGMYERRGFEVSGMTMRRIPCQP